jgi:hypothetical protein
LSVGRGLDPGLRKPRGPVWFVDLQIELSGLESRAGGRPSAQGLGVAIVDDRPVGFVAIGFFDEEATRAGEIYRIAVNPRRHHEGVGVSLMHRAPIVATGGDPGLRLRPCALPEARLHPAAPARSCENPQWVPEVLSRRAVRR